MADSQQIIECQFDCSIEGKVVLSISLQSVQNAEIKHACRILDFFFLFWCFFPSRNSF